MYRTKSTTPLLFSFFKIGSRGLYFASGHRVVLLRPHVPVRALPSLTFRRALEGHEKIRLSSICGKRGGRRIFPSLSRLSQAKAAPHLTRSRPPASGGARGGEAEGVRGAGASGGRAT